MKFNKYILGLSIIIILFSCEKIIDIEIDEKDKKIVVNGILSTDSVVKVNISKSLNILDRQDVLYLNNATVKLYENGSFIEQLNYTENGNYKTSIFKPILGNTYKVEVESSGLTSVNAENKIPNHIAINSIDTLTIEQQEDDMYGYGKQLECNVNFTDPANEKNYYYLFAKAYSPTDYDNFGNPTSYAYQTIYFNSNDNIIESRINWGEGIVFSDNLIDGETYSLKLLISKYDFYEDTNKVFFYLNSVSKDFYLYAKSYEQHMNAKGNPFVEPVQVYENITNGYGIFAGYSSYKDSIIVLGEELVW